LPVEKKKEKIQRAREREKNKNKIKIGGKPRGLAVAPFHVFNLDRLFTFWSFNRLRVSLSGVLLSLTFCFSYNRLCVSLSLGA